MELQALLVLCGLGVAGAAVLLLMGLFSSSGTSYEEAIAQQRKATSELLALAEGKNKPKKNTKKAKQKLAKKEKHKDSVSAATGSEPESEPPAESGADNEAPAKPHVEFRPPVIVDISCDTPPNVKIRKRGKDSKVKPILLNKEDPSCVSDPSAPPSPAASSLSNHFEKIHPKDEFELFHSALAAEKAVEKKEEVVEKKEQQASKAKPAKSKQGKAAAAPAAAAAAAAPEPAREEPAPRERHNSADQPKEQRKGKKEKKPQVEEAEVREEVVPPLNAPQPSELTTEKLLKQALAAAPPAAPHAPAAPAHTPPPKNKKKKQELNLMALIGAEGGGVNVSELVRLVREASLSRTEIQVLTDALLNKQHDPLPQHSEWSEGPNDPMQKIKKQLAEKEKALADEVEASQALHAKLKELRASLNAERARATAAVRGAEQAAAELLAAQARLQRAADDAHALAQEKLVLQSKLAAEGEAQAQRVQMEMHIQRLSESEATLVGQLQALQAEAAARAHEAAAARCEAAGARDAALLAQQHAADLAQQLQETSRACSELDAQRQSALLGEQAAAQDAQDRLAALSKLQGEVQRLKSRAEAAEANADKLKEEADKQRQQLSGEVASLREQLAAREAELAELRALRPAPAPAPAQNGLPPAAPAAPAAPADIKSSESAASVESAVAALREELAAARSATAEQRDAAARLRDQLHLYQDKNNEAISKAEAAQYIEVAKILGAACPAAAPAAAPGRAWLEAFAESLRAAPAAPAPAPADDDLRAQNEHLQGLVDKYKRIIDDTEGVLSRLQQNVTSEERRWAAQLADSRRELDELRLRTLTQMQNKIDALEAELRQSRPNHKYSFSEEERQTEDRLLADLSKNKLDSLNGPLQVCVEEK